MVIPIRGVVALWAAEELRNANVEAPPFPGTKRSFGRTQSQSSWFEPIRNTPTLLSPMMGSHSHGKETPRLRELCGPGPWPSRSLTIHLFTPCSRLRWLYTCTKTLHLAYARCAVPNLNLYGLEQKNAQIYYGRRATPPSYSPSHATYRRYPSRRPSPYIQYIPPANPSYRK
jgi:hypothetical protein